MWNCSKCGEQHEDALQMCWKCGTEANSAKPVNVGELLAEPSICLSLKNYLALIRGLPLPTPEQRWEFVNFVASAHSWYKHLPVWLPGAPFYFYLDRFAGCDCVARKDGSRAMVERQVQGFHYSDIPTSEYRSRFGYLNYSCSYGTAVFFPGAGAVAIPRDKMIAIPADDGQLWCLPQPILDAGRVNLTGVVHPRSAHYPFWIQMRDRRPPEIIFRESIIRWPEESGGKPVLQKIFERCVESRRPGYIEEDVAWSNKTEKDMKNCRTEAEREVLRGDPILTALIQPERERQTSEILKSVDRVCNVISEVDRS